MSTKTEHYQLNQWEPSDPFLRTDFNEDNAKLDAALAAHDVALAGKRGLVFGTFQGDGSANRLISLGVTPKAVLLARNQGETYRYPDTYGGIILPDIPLKTDDDFTAAEIVDGGFRVCYNNSESSYVNWPYGVYYYIAFV